MKLGIYSLQKVLFEGEASSVNCNTRLGRITILNHHEPLISLVERGTITVIDGNGEEHYIPAKSGFLEVNGGNEAKILIEEGKADGTI